MVMRCAQEDALARVLNTERENPGAMEYGQHLGLSILQPVHDAIGSLEEFTQVARSYSGTMRPSSGKRETASMQLTRRSTRRVA